MQYSLCSDIHIYLLFHSLFEAKRALILVAFSLFVLVGVFPD